ncbi:LysM peptidoglycan-binding domain-containing protein [Mesobacillus maritimus]|uniref:LysM peptidoglycan-binding domain-containing protein n=1 Tax=Mesobacillus maritimus TaxID=1643336 RepID=A0ABS7K1Q4_9BACI|nr:LysM peptidoglycan-binding domain-containing protein [Mesobacillus maritimus]MBY0096119.1 LysM peptidoglycan-binding domain-containing protein [Mesobacillus maritimus]
MQFFYTVRQGDTVSQIAKRWELPVESLIAANNLASPYTIYVNQQLSVPSGVDVINVKAGDTVTKIAQDYGVAPSAIIQANRLQPPYVLQIGQLLTVPPGVPFYLVQPGDTLFEIARRFNVTTGGQSNFELIREVNRLPSYTIYPGMRLMIPYAMPGESGFIAYISNSGGEFDLWVYNLGNGVNRQITFGLAESYSVPFWSPNSSKIAFVGKNGILYVISLRTNTVAQIDQFSEGLSVFLDWSPDSQKLVYSNRNSIILYNAVTHQAQTIPQSEASDVQWFPDGTELLYQAPDQNGVSQLFRIRIDGNEKKQITQNTGGRHNHVQLTPDGNYVLFTTPGASISLIFTIDLSTGKIFEVRGGSLAKNYFPTWSPNSENLAFSATAFEERGYFSVIKTTGRQGENEQTRAISNCFTTPVTWSPDGNKLAYLSGCKPQGQASEIWMLTLTHPVPIRLVAGGTITELEWSPAQSTNLNVYSHPILKISFQYPAHWARVTGERYEGSDGFFQVGAISSEDSIDTVCRNEAFHQLLPYGAQPEIVPTYIQNQEACYIFPSGDQPAEMNNQAALIVRYPTPKVIAGTNYHFFILWGDQGHITAIGKSLLFL